jgi:hypothetical protein
MGCATSSYVSPAKPSRAPTVANTSSCPTSGAIELPTSRGHDAGSRDRSKLDDPSKWLNHPLIVLWSRDDLAPQPFASTRNLHAVVSVSRFPHFGKRSQTDCQHTHFERAYAAAARSRRGKQPAPRSMHVQKIWGQREQQRGSNRRTACSMHRRYREAGSR